MDRLLARLVRLRRNLGQPRSVLFFPVVANVLSSLKDGLILCLYLSPMLNAPLSHWIRTISKGL